ncbi:MAG: amidohydrolase family protein [Armatimonadota bacterium]|nr:amidohydrolase family protein [Armatimonadota bacterium]
MIIDCHAHLGWWFFPIRQENAADLIPIMDKWKIDKAIFSSVRAIMEDCRDANKQIAAWISQYPDRMYGYITLNPHYPEIWKRDLETYTENPQFVGVKLHAAWHSCPINSKPYASIFKWCEEMKLPILAHSYDPTPDNMSPSAPERLARVAQERDVQIVMGHMGGNPIRGIKACASSGPNLSLEISAGRENAGQHYAWDLLRVRRAIDALGPERVLFGSDMPLVDPAICFGAIKDSELTPEEHDLVMWKNAARIFGVCSHV